MDVETLALVGPFAIGALVLAVSLVQVRSLLDLLDRSAHRREWLAAGLLVVCFFVGYVVAGWLVIDGRQSLLIPLTGGICLLGAIFVFLVVSAGQRSIEALVTSRDELERREDEFQRLYEVTDVLNRVLRHNLRNNMNVILGRSDMLDERVDEGEHVEAIKSEARRLVEIGEKARAIHETLDADLDAQVRPVESYVASAVDGVRGEFPEATVTVDDTEDVWVEVGPLFETALENVLDNGVRHNEGPASVHVGVSADEQTVAVTVADDGPGIHPYEVEAIRDHRETPLQHGSGLGLWLASWIVDQYGGDVAFDENQPRGTVVTLEVPRADHPAAAGGVERSVAGGEVSEGETPAASGSVGDPGGD